MADRPGAAPRAWQRMLSGRRLDLVDPSPLDIEIADIAHGLARVARWNGQTVGDHAFSVAQHALLVEVLVRRMRPGCDRRTLMGALLHDAPEYVIGDMISPFKAVLGSGYKQVEHRLLAAVHLRFGLPAELPLAVTRLIKRADLASAYLEATRLAGFAEPEARTLFGVPRGIDPDLPEIAGLLVPCPAGEVQTRFLARFAELDAVG